MKKSRTARAVDALMRVVTWHKLHPDGHPKEWPEPRPLTVYRAAKRYGWILRASCALSSAGFGSVVVPSASR